MPNRKSPRNRRPIIEPLEPRLLFSATADIAVLDDANSDTAYLIHAAANTDLDAIYHTALADASAELLQLDAPRDAPQAVVFIDTRVEDYQTLLDDILQNTSTEEVSVVLLDADSDGVGQITEALKNYAGISAVHVISHGTAGAVQLGNTLLNQHSLSQYEGEIAAWGNALGESADLLFYGCNLAGSAEGIQLVEQLAALTRADVAASNDLTGHLQQGGDWELEVVTGTIETASLFSVNLQQQWQGVLADVNHIHVDDAVNALSFSSSHNVGQSFVYDSSNPTYIVNQLSIQLMKDAGAAEQTITVQLLDAWNGTVLGVDTKSSNSLSSTEFEWKTFDFGDLELADNQTYFIRISSDVNDGLVMVSYHQEDRYNNATLIENGTDNPDSWDLAFKVTEDDGTNTAPTLANPITNQSATEQVAFNYTVPADTFSDSDEGDTLVYTAQLAGGGNLPPWLNFDAANRTFWGMPDNGDVGTITIEVTVTDDHGASTSDNFDLTIINTNDDPFVANPIADQAATEDVTFNFTFPANAFGEVDPGDQLTYTAQLSGGGALPAWLSFDSATRTFSGTPAASDVGTIAIEVTADDGNGGTPATDTFDLVIYDASVAAATIYETSGASLDTNILSPGQNLYQSFFHNSGNGTYLVDYIALQLRKDPAAQLQDIHVSLLQNIGDVTAIAEYTLSSADVGTTLAWEAFYVNNLALTDGEEYFIKVSSSGSDGLISIGIHNVDMYPNGMFYYDSGTPDASRDLAFQVASTVNNAPIVASPIPNQNAPEDAPFNFVVDANTFSDVDGDGLTYSATLAGGGALPAWLSFDAATRTFSGTPTNSDVGTVSITVNVNDGQGGVASDTFDIVIANTNDAPVVNNPINDQVATEDSAFNFTFPANAFSDPDLGDSLTYSAELTGGGALPAWLNFDAATRTFSGTPVNNDVGTFSVSVTADDGNGGTATDIFDITVITTGDTHYVDTGSGNRETPISSVNQVGQSFLYDSPGATYNVNEISIELAKYAVAVPQTIIVEVRDAWDGTLLASDSMSSDAISAIGFEWHSFSFTNLALNDNQSYVIRVRTDANDDAILIRHHDVDLFPDGAMIQNGVPDGAGWDLAFKVSQEDGSNTAPVVDNPLPDHTVNEDDNFSYTVPANTFSDADVNDTLTYRAQLAGGGSLDWLVFNEITRTFSGIPRNDDIGTLNVEVIATDNHGASVADVFTITIVNTNDDPFVRFPLADQAVTENNAFSYTVPADAFGDDDAGAVLTYTTQLAGGGALPSWLTFDAATRTFTGTPVAGDVGTLDIEVSADDGQGGTPASDSFSLVVYAAPADADIVYESSPPALNGTGLADAQDVYQSFVEANGNGTYVVDNISVQLRRNPDADQTPQTITVSVLDSFNGTVLASNTLSSTELGTALAWYSFDVDNLGLTYGQTYFIKVSATGSNTDPLVYVGIHDTDVYGGGEYHNHNGIPDPGRDLAFEISGINNAPVVSNPLVDQIATEDVPFTFVIPANSFTDPDGDTLTYTAQLAGGGALPPWLSFDSATRSFSGTATHLDTGMLSIEVIATDANGTFTSDTFDLTVERVNSAPTTTGVADITRDANSGSDTVDLFAAFADEEDSDAQLTFSVVGNSNSALFSAITFDPVSGNLQLDYPADQSGSSIITLRATDRDGDSVETSFTVTIMPLNSTPTTTGLDNVSATTATPTAHINLRDFFDDAEDGADLLYAVANNSNPALASVAALDSSTGTLTLQFSNGTPGETTLTLRATDTQGASVETSVIVTLAAPVAENPVEEPVDEPVNPPVENPVERPVENPEPPAETPDEEPANPPVPVNPTLPGSSTDEPVTGAPSSPPPDQSGAPNPSDTPMLPPQGDRALVDEPITNDGDTVLSNNLGEPAVFIAPADIPQGYDEDDRNRPAWTDARREYEEQQRQAANPYASLTNLIALESGYLNTQELIEFHQEIDRARADMTRVLEEEQQQHAMIAGVTLSITTGILIWSLRASSLLLTLFSMLPLWKGIDPLPILDEVNKRKKELEQQRKDKAREDRRAGEVGYLFDHNNKDN